jgi:hypothetical protein
MENVGVEPIADTGEARLHGVRITTGAGPGHKRRRERERKRVVGTRGARPAARR